MMIIKSLNILIALLLGVGLVLLNVAPPESTVVLLIGISCLILSIAGTSIKFVLSFAHWEERLKGYRRNYTEAAPNLVMLGLLISIVSLWLTLVISFAGIYFGLMRLEPKSLVDEQGAVYQGVWWQDATNCFYYSVITVTTLGYGDIKPAPGKDGIFIKWVSTLEVVLGVFWLTWYFSCVVATRIRNNP